MEIKSKDLKVRFFETNRGSYRLEENINNWLSKNDITIFDIKYNANISYNDGRSESLYTAMVLYK